MIELELREVEERFRLLMEGVKDYAIFMLDTEGRVTCWNAGAERLLGFQEDEIIGRHFSLFFTPDDVQNGVPERELRKAREEGRASDDRWHVHKDGTRFWASGIVTPLWDHKLRGYAKVMRNLTEQKMTEDALRKSEDRYRKLAKELDAMNQRKNKFLAMLGHELRNPLAPVLTALQVMRQDQPDNPIQLQARNIIERQVRQLAHLVDDLLEVSRLAAGKIKLRKEPVEMRIVMERAVETARPLIDTRQHRLTISLPDQPVWSQADPNRLEQVFVNLLANAAKYTPDGGEIFLILRREADGAVVRVRDTGIGIAPELLPHIFDLFTQAEQGLDRSQGGLGIGLALVKAYVEMHEGSVEAGSAGPRLGSEFVVRLPIRQAPDKGRPAAAKPALSRPASLRMLVVDDNKDGADSLAMLLRFEGHEVRVAYTGPTAIQEAIKCRPQIILLDIGLPGMDGYELARRLRRQAETQQATLIAMTGYGLESDKEQAKAAGFDYHLVKPVDPTKLEKLLAIQFERSDSHET
jgi:PAS domain S-box-containing protein